MRIVVALLLSVMVALYAPVTAVTHAAENATEVKELKAKIDKEIDTRISTLQRTLDSLKVDSVVTATKDASTSVIVGKSGLKAMVVFPTDLKAKSKDFLQKITTELTKMKTKTAAASSLSSVQSLANSLDTQSNLAAAANVQAAVMQSVESMTGVFDSLKVTANNLQSQITLLKECVPGSDTAASKDECQGVSGSSSTATALQSQLDTIGTMMYSVASTVASSIALLNALLTAFTNMLKSIGGTDGLSNLSNLTSTADVAKLNASFGDINGLLLSYTAIASQIDSASTMSTNIQGLLSTLSGQINQ